MYVFWAVLRQRFRGGGVGIFLTWGLFEDAEFPCRFFCKKNLYFVGGVLLIYDDDNAMMWVREPVKNVLADFVR